MSKIVIGIDQSYTRTGLTVLKDKKPIRIGSEDFKDCETNTDKRKHIAVLLRQLILFIKKDYGDNIIVITERIRLRSGNDNGKSKVFLSEDYIKATGALVSTIIDTCRPFKIPVYSVETRSWKSQIVGSSKPLDNPYGIDPKKYPTILYMKRKGLLKYIAEEYRGRGKKGVIWANKGGEKVPCKMNDDTADSYCIALYGFLPESKQKLREEKF